MEEYLSNGVLPPTRTLRQLFASRVLDFSNGAYHIGLTLGFLARAFGARAPVSQIAR